MDETAGSVLDASALLTYPRGSPAARRPHGGGRPRVRRFRTQLLELGRRLGAFREALR